jgi:hypothetical protein
MIVGARCRLKNNRGIRNRKPFLVHEDGDDDVKNLRRFAHLGIFESKG